MISIDNNFLLHQYRCDISVFILRNLWQHGNKHHRFAESVFFMKTELVVIKIRFFHYRYICLSSYTDNDLLI